MYNDYIMLYIKLYNHLNINVGIIVVINGQIDRGTVDIPSRGLSRLTVPSMRALKRFDIYAVHQRQ